MKTRSIQWCITRLRRLIHASTVDPNDSDRNIKRDNDQHIQQQIERLIEDLDVRSIADTLHVSQIIIVDRVHISAAKKKEKSQITHVFIYLLFFYFFDRV